MAHQNSEHTDNRTKTEANDYIGQRQVDTRLDASDCQQQFEKKLREIRSSVDQNSPYHLLITGFLRGLEATLTSNDKKAAAALDQIKQAIKQARQAPRHAVPSAKVDGISRDILDDVMQKNRELERKYTALTSRVAKYEWNDRINTADREFHIESNGELAQEPDESPDTCNGTRDTLRGEATEAAKLAEPARPVTKPVNIAWERLDADGDKSVATARSSPESYFGVLADYEDEPGFNQDGENMTVLHGFSDYLPMSASGMEENNVNVKEVDTSRETNASRGRGVNHAKVMVTYMLTYMRENVGRVLLRHPIQLGIGLFQIVGGLLVWKEMADTLVERNQWMDANGLSRLYLLQSLAYQHWGAV